VNAGRKRRTKKGGAEAVPDGMQDMHPAESALFEDME
jgi:hypothetical protein